MLMALSAHWANKASIFKELANLLKPLFKRESFALLRGSALSSTDGGGEMSSPLPSMRLLLEIPRDGTCRVLRVCRDGRLVVVFRGSPEEWLGWSPPEILRDEGRMAEWPKAKGEGDGGR